MARFSQTMRVAALLATAVAALLWASLDETSLGLDYSPGCLDDAELVSRSGENEGEASVRVLVGDPRRLAATWTRSKFPIPAAASPLEGEVVFARRSVDLDWDETVLAGSLDEGTAGDPWLDTFPDGTSYVSYVTGQGLSTFVREIPLQGPVDVPRATGQRFDHPAIAADQLVRGRIYVAGERFYPDNGRAHILVGEDGGRVWSANQRFPDPLPEYAQQGIVTLASGKDTVMAAWLERNYMVNPELNAVRVGRVNRRTGAIDNVATLSEFSGDLEFDLGGAIVPSLAVTRNGPRAGQRVFLTWPERVGDEAAVKLVASKDAGVSWGTVQTVNDDAGAGNINIFPSVTGLDNGGAYVGWFSDRKVADELLVYGSQIEPEGSIGADEQLTDCPSYAEFPGVIGDYFNMDSSVKGPVWVFSNIRRQDGGSNVYLLDSSDGR